MRDRREGPGGVLGTLGLVPLRGGIRSAVTRPLRDTGPYLATTAGLTFPAASIAFTRRCTINAPTCRTRMHMATHPLRVNVGILAHAIGRYGEL